MRDLGEHPGGLGADDRVDHEHDNTHLVRVVGEVINDSSLLLLHCCLADKCAGCDDSGSCQRHGGIKELFCRDVKVLPSNSDLLCGMAKEERDKSTPKSRCRRFVFAFKR